MNPEPVDRVWALLEKEVGTTIQEGKLLNLIRLGQAN